MKNNRIKILDFAKREMADLEPWDGYFDFRFVEFDVLFDFLQKDVKKNFKEMKILEIGTGIGLVAGFLAEEFKEVVTVDLPEKSSATHSVGKEKIAAFLAGLNLGNVKYFSADARDLSIFENDFFDVVYSSQVFEHIPIDGRGLAMKEISRVLKNNGLMIAVVPNFMERIYEFFHYYFAFLLKKIKIFFLKNSYDRFTRQDINPAGSKKEWWQRILPPPHGVYKNSFQEILYHFPSKWLSLCENLFCIVGVYTNKMSIPLSTPFFLNFYKQHNKIDKILGRVFPFKYLGRTLVIIGVKNK